MQYQARLMRLLPSRDELPFVLFDDIVIGCQWYGRLIIVISAPVTSDLIVAPLMQTALSRMTTIISMACDSNLTEETLIKRDNYIKLQRMIQEEISPSGVLRFCNIEQLKVSMDF
jgi:hypothetical protein